MEVQRLAKKRKKSNKSPPGFKKAPQAPRRFKSPYILFSISKIQTYKQIYKNAKVTSFSSAISKEWKSLSVEEKNRWKIAAERDKMRYNAEKLLYKGPWQVPSNRPRKDPSAPKRPPSAFLNYSRTRRTELIEENPHVKNTDISKLLGMEWRTIPQELRQPHIDKEVREREIYNREMTEWRKQQNLKKEIATTTKDMSFLMKDKEVVEREARVSPMPRTLSLPAEIQPASVLSCAVAKVTPPRKLRKVVQGSASFSTPGCMPKTLIDSTDKTNQVWPSFVSLETSNSENIDAVQYFPNATPSNGSCASQNYRFPLPTPPFVIPEPQPISPCLLSRQKNSAGAPVVQTSNVHPIKDRALSINTDIELPYSIPEPTPVTPLPTPRRRVSTTDYQELFFPHAMPSEKDDSTDSINPYVDFLLNSTIEGTD